VRLLELPEFVLELGDLVLIATTMSRSEQS
jgi:hypothetical protein